MVSFQASAERVTPPLTQQYKNIAIQVVATKSSLAFFDWEGLQNFTGVTVWQDEKEWHVRFMHSSLQYYAYFYGRIGRE